MAAAAIDQYAADAHLAHLALRDLDGTTIGGVGVMRLIGRGIPPTMALIAQSQMIDSG